MQIQKTTADLNYFRNLHQLLKQLDSKSKYKINQLLKKTDKTTIIKLCEIIYNILHGTIPIKESEKKN